MQQASKGNALIEYGIIGTVMTVMAIAVLLVTGSDLANWLGGLRDDMARTVANADNSRNRNNAGPNGTAGITGNSASSGGSNQDGGSGETSGDNGAEDLFEQASDAANGSNNSGTTVTSGVNGDSDVTSTYASRLENIAEQLEESNADPALIELIQALANQGHELASKQQQLETECPPGKTCAIVDEDSGDGYDKLYTIEDLLSKIQNGKQTFEQTYNQLQSLLAANPNLPADLRREIEQQANQIIAVAGGYKQQQKPIGPRKPLNSGSGLRTMNSYEPIDPITGLRTSVTVTNTAGGNSSTTTTSSNNICATQPNRPECTKPGSSSSGTYSSSGYQYSGNGSSNSTGTGGG